MLYAVFFIAIFFLLFGLLLTPFEKRNQAKRRVQQLLEENKQAASLVENQERESFRKRVFIPLWTDLKKSFSKSMPGKQADKLDKSLQQAGNPFQMKAADFSLVQM